MRLEEVDDVTVLECWLEGYRREERRGGDVEGDKKRAGTSSTRPRQSGLSSGPPRPKEDHFNRAAERKNSPGVAKGV